MFLLFRRLFRDVGALARLIVFPGQIIAPEPVTFVQGCRCYSTLVLVSAEGVSLQLAEATDSRERERSGRQQERGNLCSVSHCRTLV